MSRYCPISLEEMRDFLKIEKGWIEGVSGNELVFLYTLKNRQEITIKVFSGIKKSDSQSRGCGQDAIRICAINTAKNIGWIATTRVYRTINWRDNLKARVEETIAAAKNRIR